MEAIGSAWGGTSGEAGIQVHPLERARAGPAGDWQVAGGGGVGGATADRGLSLRVAGDNVSWNGTDPRRRRRREELRVLWGLFISEILLVIRIAVPSRWLDKRVRCSETRAGDYIGSHGPSEAI